MLLRSQSIRIACVVVVFVVVATVLFAAPSFGQHVLEEPQSQQSQQELAGSSSSTSSSSSSLCSSGQYLAWNVVNSLQVTLQQDGMGLGVDWTQSSSDQMIGWVQVTEYETGSRLLLDTSFACMSTDSPPECAASTAALLAPGALAVPGDQVCVSWYNQDHLLIGAQSSVIAIDGNNE